jgi:hypothetical protein
MMTDQTSCREMFFVEFFILYRRFSVYRADAQVGNTSREVKKWGSEEVGKRRRIDGGFPTS